MTDTPTPKDSINSGAPSLSVDWKLYEHYLDESDLSDEQKEEVINALLELVVAFVDLGFDIQSSDETCEQVDENRILLPADLLKSIEDAPSIETTGLDGSEQPRPKAEEKS